MQAAALIDDEDYVNSEDDTDVLTDSSMSDHEVGSYASTRLLQDVMILLVA